MPARSESLARHPAFAGFVGDACEAVAALCDVATLPARGVVFREGDKAEDVYFVIRGRCRVTCSGGAGRAVVVGWADSGSFIGEMALVGDAPRGSTVVADGPVTLIRMPSSAVQGLVEDGHPGAVHLLRSIRRHLVLRVRDADSRVDAIIDGAASGGP